MSLSGWSSEIALFSTFIRGVGAIFAAWSAYQARSSASLNMVTGWLDLTRRGTPLTAAPEQLYFV
jgi:hypothetical protein